MLKFGTILSLLVFVTGLTKGQELEIELNLPAAAGQEVLFTQYYLGSIYVKDTVRLDESGSGVFTSESTLPQGMYKVFLDESNNFDLLLEEDQKFTVTNPGFSPETAQITGSEKTAAFIEYVKFLRNLQNEGAQLRQQISTAGPEQQEQLRAELAGLTEKLHNRWDEIGETYPNSFLSKFVKANYVEPLDISTLPEEIQNNDSLLLRARFEFQHEHYWDNFDYTDERFLYSPFYEPKLETWFTKVLYQEYDSVKPYVFDFIEDVKPNERIFQFVTSWFLNSSVNSDIMGMDALFVDLAREYYLSGEAFWATEESMDRIEENLLFAENNLIGMTAPDLTLESVDGEYFNLHQVEAPVTVVLIYEPNCSHCMVFVPEFHDEVYEEYKNKGLEVYAIYSMNDKQEWVDFLTEHNLYDWINVWDENHISRFKILYDARTTPGVYVLNQDKEIVAKKMSVEQLRNYMERELN